MAIAICIALRALPFLVKLDNLSSEQCVLQRPTNVHNHHSTFDRQRNRLVLEDRLGELVGLDGEGVLEPLPVLRLNLMSDSQSIGKDHVVGLGNHVDRQLACLSSDFGAHVMAMRLGSRAVEVSNLASPELNDTDSVVNIR